MMFGHLPLAYMNDCTIHSVCQNNSTAKIPWELAANLMIQRCCHFSLQTLTSNYENPLGLPDETDVPLIVSGIDEKFAELQTFLGSDLSYMNTVRLLSAKLYFQCTYFLYDNMTAERMAGILDAFTTASSLLTILISHPDSHNVLSHAPPGISHLIFMASTVLFRVLHSSYAILASLDRGAGHVLYSAAASLVLQTSVQYNKNDMAIRMSEIMRNLWRWAEGDAELRTSPPKLLVKSRIGSSCVYDCLIILRRYQLQRYPGLGELQTGENLEPSQHSNQQQLMPPISGALPWPNIDVTSGLDVSARDLQIGDAQSRNSAESIQAWDLSNMAWLDNFEYPGLFDVSL
jgi:hypothetical protein